MLLYFILHEKNVHTQLWSFDFSRFQTGKKTFIKGNSFKFNISCSIRVNSQSFTIQTFWISKMTCIILIKGLIVGVFNQKEKSYLFAGQHSCNNHIKRFG